jgi:hypothetical protein
VSRVTLAQNKSSSGIVQQLFAGCAAVCLRIQQA